MSKVKIISIISSKGGSGKSTISLLLSGFLSNFYKTALLDCDIQSTCISAKEVNPSLPYKILSTPHSKEILIQGQKLEQDGTEWIIIDTNPRSFLENPTQIEELIKLSDLCVMPCRPAPRDVRANLKLAEKISQQKAKARILWNFVQPRINAHKESMDQAPKLLGLKPLTNFLKQRACYQDVFDELPLPTNNKDAKQEIENIFEELKVLLI